MSSFAVIPRLKYFAIEGVAEKVRLTFKMAGVEFVDDRFAMSEWPTVKPTTPNGQVPLLYIGDRIITQSGAMARWVAAQGNGSLYPVRNLELCLKIDELIGYLDDDARDYRTPLYMGMRPSAFGYPDDYNTTPEGKEMIKTMREGYVANDLPRYMGHLTAALRESGGPYLTGKSITLADLFWLPRLRHLCSGVADHIPKDCLDSYTEVCRYRDAVMAVPTIADWYAKK